MEQNTENTEPEALTETEDTPKLSKERIAELMKMLKRGKNKGCRHNSNSLRIAARRQKNKNARSERRRQRRAA